MEEGRRGEREGEKRTFTVQRLRRKITGSEIQQWTGGIYRRGRKCRLGRRWLSHRRFVVLCASRTREWGEHI